MELGSPAHVADVERGDLVTSLDGAEVINGAGLAVQLEDLLGLPHPVTHPEHHLDRVLAQLLGMLPLCRQACILLGYRTPWFIGGIKSGEDG